MFDIGQFLYSTAMIGADYEEYKLDTMKGYYVAFEARSPEPERFANLDDALAFAWARAENVLTSSSVDNYAADSRAASK